MPVTACGAGTAPTGGKAEPQWPSARVILSGLLAQVGAVVPGPRARQGQLPQGHCWPEGRMGLDAPHSPARP